MPPSPSRPDPALELLAAAGVTFVVVARGAIVPASFARNVERLAGALAAEDALLAVAGGSEWFEVEPTVALLRRCGRSVWSAGGVVVDVDLEPLPGVGYAELVYESESGDDGFAWARAPQREAIALARRQPRARPVSRPRVALAGRFS